MIQHEQENVTNHAERSQLVIDKAIDRVRKLLALAKGTSEHEAALAAGQATRLIEQFQLTEAMVRIDEPEAKAEPIQKAARLEPELSPYASGGENDAGVTVGSRKRVAWKESIALAVASDLGVHMFWRNHVDVCGFGRESAIQTWRYTYQYLVNVVNELTEKAWSRMGQHGGSSARAWKNAFRVGCAQRVSVRIWEAREKRKREAARKRVVVDTQRAVVENARADAAVATKDALAGERECLALAIVERDQAEVDNEYENYSKGWGRAQAGIGSVTSGDGYSAGKAAGDRVRLGGANKHLTAGQARLRGGK